MGNYEQFQEHVSKVAQEFKALYNSETIHLVSHLDADGISSGALAIATLTKLNIPYSVSIVNQLTKEVLNELAREDCSFFLFTDLGCGQISFIKEALPGKTVFILDHHIPEEVEVPANIHVVNPHFFEIDGSTEISGAGVVYLFGKALEPSMDEFAHVAIIGAVGDIQDKGGFARLNQMIVEDAVKKGKIKVITGLRLFGAQTRPLHKTLEYSNDPYIPGVTGSESGAIQFLQQLGIDPKEGKAWRKIVHLTEEEKMKLIEGIILKRLGEDKPEDVLGKVFLLREEKKESPLRDVKEFATLLNSCGRMNKASLGIGACLGDEGIKKKAIASLSLYRRKIVDAITWYEQVQDSEAVTKGDGYVIINAKDRIMGSIIGTMASMVAKSNKLKPNTFILAMADLLDGTSKVSLRLSGHKPSDVDLREVVTEIAEKVGDCEAGGHLHAAGAMLPSDKEEIFIAIAKEVLEKRALEVIP